MSANDNDLPAYTATVEDVARHFGVVGRTVRRWVELTDIPHRKIGTVTRFRISEVDAWAARGGRPAESGEEGAA